jgi:hypothetical protein
MYFYNSKPKYMNFKQRYIFLFKEVKHLILEPKNFWNGKRAPENEGYPDPARDAGMPDELQSGMPDDLDKRAPENEDNKASILHYSSLPAYLQGEQTTTNEDNPVSSIFIPLVLGLGLAIFAGEVIHSVEILWSYAISKAVTEIISYSLQLAVSIPVLTALLKTYGGAPRKKTVRLVVTYSFVPFILASLVTGLFPALYIVSIAGLYGFYLFALGALIHFDIPVENQSRYVILAILLIILIFGDRKSVV